MKKKWRDETHDKKQNWETRREKGKKWGDETRDKTSSIRTKMRPIYVRMKEFS